MRNPLKSAIWIGVGISLLLAAFIAPFASSSPDGLERIAKDHGFLGKSEAPGVSVWNHAPVKDYAMPGVKNEKVATGAAGVAGALGTFAAAYGFARLACRKNSDKA